MTNKILVTFRKVLGTALAIAGLVMLTGTSDCIPALALCFAGSLACIYFGYKLATLPSRHA